VNFDWRMGTSWLGWLVCQNVLRLTCLLFRGAYATTLRQAKPAPIQTSSRKRRRSAKVMPVTSEYPKALSKSKFPPSWAPRLQGMTPSPLDEERIPSNGCSGPQGSYTG
jgi:hypothetical protein